MIGALFILPVYQYIVLDKNGSQMIGSAAIAEYQILFDDPVNVSKDSTTKSLTDDAYYRYVFPYLDYWKLINGNYLLSSRYGKSKLVAFGTDGWNLPIQVLNSIAPYSLSLFGATLTEVVTLYFVLLGMVSLTLLLSAKMKSSVPVLAMIILIVMLPMFLGISETSGIWNRILVLLPYRATQPVFSNDFYGYCGYPLGSLSFDIVTVRIVVYMIIALLCVPFARNA